MSDTPVYDSVVGAVELCEEIDKQLSLVRKINDARATKTNFDYDVVNDYQREKSHNMRRRELPNRNILSFQGSIFGFITLYIGLCFIGKSLSEYDNFNLDDGEYFVMNDHSSFLRKLFQRF